MAVETTVKNVKEYLCSEATEPMTLSQMAAKGVFSPLQSKEEEISLWKVLEVEPTLVYKDVSTMEKEKKWTVRAFWRRGESSDKYCSHSEVKRTPVHTLNCSILPSSLRSRRPFVSPARTKKAEVKEEQKASPLYIPKRKNCVQVCSSNRTSCRLDKVKNADILSKDIEELRDTMKGLEEEIEALSVEYSEEELQEHIDKLHEYNEVKDIGQLLLGKLAEVEGTTTSSLYQRFGLKLDS